MKVKAKVTKDGLSFSSILARIRFFEQFQGKDVLIQADDAPTAELRRYFEGCLVPITFYTHPFSGWTNFKDARTALKTAFLATKVTGMDGSSYMVAKSTTELNKGQFGQFIEAVVHWLLENQLCVELDLDPETYKQWRDAAPEKDAIYPPVARIKERYERAKLDK